MSAIAETATVRALAQRRIFRIALSVSRLKWAGNPRKGLPPPELPVFNRRIDQRRAALVLRPDWCSTTELPSTANSSWASTTFRKNSVSECGKIGFLP